MENKILDVNDVKTTSINDLMDTLSATGDGLNTTEAQKRLKIYGLNQLYEEKKGFFEKVIVHFWGPIPWMIEGALIISGLLGDWIDFTVIFALLMINGGVGFWQEYQADNAIEMLKKKLAYSARVLRDGEWTEIPSPELVPGDIIRVRYGDIIPADMKLIDGEYISVDESVLTGESLPVEKVISAIAYSGTIIHQGVMTALVISTGMNTYFGKTAHLITEVKGKSNLERAVIKIGNYLIIMDVILVSFIIALGLYHHESISHLLIFALVLSIASIPIAQPAVLSVTMAVGATALARKQAIVSKLSAIVEMAGMTILCADKTGTITENLITIADLQSVKPFQDEDVLLYSALASQEEDHDPIDMAIIEEARDREVKFDDENLYQRLKFTPFDPVAKRTESLIESKNNKFKTTKGAPQVILDLSSNKDQIGSEVEEQVKEYASRGYRALGVATNEKNDDWEFVGLIALHDPPKKESAKTIALAGDMGTEVKMITGDHQAIAQETARQVGLGTEIYTPDVFLDKPEAEARKIVSESHGFAQVFPEHKYRIVELLQEEGHIVGMTGDGVNDAPALKRADAGIAVSEATDAAKSAADIVLTKSGLCVIVSAIKESRKIFQRMKSYSIYRVTETLRILIFTALAIVIFGFYPVSAIMLVLLALLDDIPIMTIAYDRTDAPPNPRKWDMTVVLGMSTLLGLIGVATSFMLLYVGKQYLLLSIAAIQSFIFLKLVVAGHLTMFATRLEKPWWTKRPSVILFSAVIGTDIAATIVVMLGLGLVTPIGLYPTLLVWGFAIAGFLIEDVVKVWFYKRLNKRELIELEKRKTPKMVISGENK